MNKIESLINDFMKSIFHDEIVIDNFSEESRDIEFTLINKLFKDETYVLIDTYCQDENELAEYLSKYFFDSFKEYIEDLRKSADLALCDEPDEMEYENCYPSIDDIAYSMGFDIDDDGHWTERSNDDFGWWSYDNCGPHTYYEEIDGDNVYEYEDHIFFKTRRIINRADYEKKIMPFSDHEYSDDPFEIKPRQNLQNNL
ncbi:hypothetical protein HFE03_08090 [Paenibacillus sp. EKM102P]|uniref:hypothetical protein n=1 Tax=unclassified Paenibacillus TaxID=185978 RepID=UPI00142DA96D|nr:MULTISPECIES: hypothetical protein [unclassified Paenibacillus]KAF6620602.1 hypothetical protein HFE00_05990 [Paenibacillus sp. EKM101P]KAF6623595.1 hypothetical protein HFE03_08090 [Paenibacillus sp. EKM102P]KAF6633844.1 hypothetical protein HFE01_06425 [Paenibacillus sp. EKM10P]KAF6649369.1 hypothetical protein HFE02_01380 [Paenibacillus sp. EKM11P]